MFCSATEGTQCAHSLKAVFRKHTSQQKHLQFQHILVIRSYLRGYVTLQQVGEGLRVRTSYSFTLDEDNRVFVLDPSRVKM